MAKVTLLVNGMNRTHHALAAAVKAAMPTARICDACADPGARVPGAEATGPTDRPLRTLPTLLVDSDDGRREIARLEAAAIAPALVAARLADGTYARADAGAPAIRRPEDEPEPGAAALARIKAGQGTVADLLTFVAARF